MKLIFISLQMKELPFFTELLIFIAIMLVILWVYHRIFSGRGVRKQSLGSVDLSRNKSTENQDLIAEETAAVIGLALNMYKKQIKDYEKAKLTIARVSRTYSPWSSKIYGLRQNPRK